MSRSFLLPATPGWDPERSFRNHDAHVRTLLGLVRGDVALLSYEQMYRNQYNLVAHGHGEQVYWHLRKMLERMSLCMHKRAYDGAVELLHMVSLHLDNRWCVHHQLPGANGSLELHSSRARTHPPAHFCALTCVVRGLARSADVCAFP